MYTVVDLVTFYQLQSNQYVGFFAEAHTVVVANQCCRIYGSSKKEKVAKKVYSCLRRNNCWKPDELTSLASSWLAVDRLAVDCLLLLLLYLQFFILMWLVKLVKINKIKEGFFSNDLPGDLSINMFTVSKYFLRFYIKFGVILI